MEYGLIGAKLGHSYSKIIHEMLCGYHYDLCPLPTEEEARAFLAKRQFKAINVTIPYKKLVMEYCSYIDPRAKAIGAVNTVVNKNGLLYGYNTDYMGFAHLCDAHGVNFAGRTVLILGTGGTHNTTSAVARDKGAAKVLTVSRHPDPEKGELSYAEAVWCTTPTRPSSSSAPRKRACRWLWAALKCWWRRQCMPQNIFWTASLRMRRLKFGASPPHCAGIC